MNLTPLPDSAAPWASQGMVLLDFWAPWCHSCKALMPTLESLLQAHPAIQAFKVNTEEPYGAALAEAFAVASLPTILLFKDGKIVGRVSGSLNRTQIRDFLEMSA